MNAQRLTGILLAVAVVGIALAGAAGWRDLSARSDKTQRQLAQVAQALTEVQAATAGSSRAVASLETMLGGTDSRIDAVATAVGALRTDLTGTASSIAGLTTDLGAVREELAGLSIAFNQTSQLASGLQTDLAAASARLDQTGSRTQALANEVSSLSAASSGLLGRVGEVETGLGQLTSDIAALNANVLRLQQAVAQQSSQAVAAGAGGNSAGGGSARLSVAGTVTLTINPANPYAGQDIDFALQGLEPWQRVIIAMVQPDGVAALWVTESEAFVSDGRGNRLAQETLYADGSGQLQWKRVATQDGEGLWRVQVTFGGATHSIPYQVSQLQFTTERIQRFGLDLRRYQGLSSDVYFSSGVSTALVLDLRAHIFSVRTTLSRRLGLQSVSIPDLYLFGSHELFTAAGRSIGVPITNEAGFFKTRQPFDGIYIRVDSFLGDLRETLTHELVHLLLDERAPGVSWPAWVNEGLATYHEHLIALASDRAPATLPRIYTRVDRARQALTAGALPPLASLESQFAWNAQRDPVFQTLQYATAYLAIRFLSERHGDAALVSLMNPLADRQTLAQAIPAATGQTYSSFEEGFRVWVREFPDGDRQTAREYNGATALLLTEWRGLMDQRRANLSASSIPVADLVTAGASSLRQRVQILTPPARWAAVQQEFIAFLDRGIIWLTLEREFVRTGTDARRTQANAMIPEINAREHTIRQNLNELAFQYQLQ